MYINFSSIVLSLRILGLCTCLISFVFWSENHLPYMPYYLSTYLSFISCYLSTLHVLLFIYLPFISCYLSIYLIYLAIYLSIYLPYKSDIYLPSNLPYLTRLLSIYFLSEPYRHKGQVRTSQIITHILAI